MSTKSEKNKKKEQNFKEPTELNKLIIQEAVNQYKEGKLKSGLDVEIIYSILDMSIQNLESLETLEMVTASLKL